MIDEAIPVLLNTLCDKVHHLNAKWWVNIETGELLDRNIGELLMLTVSELAEALEGHRKNLMDDKLPHRKMFEVELADTIIRIFDIAGGLRLDLGGAFYEKLKYNQIREDHQIEARLGANGKKY
jgi:plasmid maintenance system antidote protein VapI